MTTTLNKSLFLLFFVSFAVLIPTLLADDDAYWEAQAEKAKKAAADAYHPNPEDVNVHLNDHTEKFMMRSNETRRSLGRKDEGGPCMPSNPIDHCWRCNPNWHLNRKRLADCVLGFGRNVTGGKDGPIYVVTDSSDNPQHPAPGTLRHAVTQHGPLWIIFARSMIITLEQELLLSCDKTIDGRGGNIHIAFGAGLSFHFVNNLIIHNVHIHDIIVKDGGMIKDAHNHTGLRTESDGDGINIFGATRIWIDHCSMYRCYDGLIDAIMGSTAITISNCHFTNHNDVMLFGASDSHTEDEKMQVTIAFNHFGRGLVQRMPRVRFGYIHLVNNDYTHWDMYALGGSKHPTITRLELTSHQSSIPKFRFHSWKHKFQVNHNSVFRMNHPSQHSKLANFSSYERNEKKRRHQQALDSQQRYRCISR